MSSSSANNVLEFSDSERKVVARMVPEGRDKGFRCKATRRDSEGETLAILPEEGQARRWCEKAVALDEDIWECLD